MNRKTLIGFVIGILLFGLIQYVFQTFSQNEGGDVQIQRAFDQQLNDVQVRGSGIVTRLLEDDEEGSRHQKFILELDSGQTLLIAHNIDLAPRINSLQEGDRIEFYGEYEWNPQGGVVHWTHHDPDGHHPGGWIKHEGNTYE